MSAFGSSCCNKLQKYVDQIYLGFSTGEAQPSISNVVTFSDPLEAVKKLAAPGGIEPEGLTRAEVETLCAALNVRFVMEGHPEVFVSPDSIPTGNYNNRGDGRIAGPKETITSSNKYCGEEIWGANAISVAQTLGKAAGDVCFYGCFAAVLYQSAIQRYNNVKEAFMASTAALERLLQQIIQAPGSWLEINVEFAQDILSMLQELKNNVWDNVQSLANGREWHEILWLYIKSFVVRYKNSLVLGIIQMQMDSLRSSLMKRADYYSELEQKLQLIANSVASLAGQDWWNKLVESVQQAQASINNADQALQRAQIGAATGSMNEVSLKEAKTDLVVAKNAISSVDMIEATLKELGDALTSDPFSFRWAAGRAIKNDFMEDLKTLGEEIDDARDIVACIAFQTQKILEMSSLVQLTSRLLNSTTGAVQLEASLDVTVDATMIEQLRRSLRSLYGEMETLLSTGDRTSAPGYISAWNAALRLNILEMNALNIGNSIPWGSPLGIGGYTDSIGAVNELNVILVTGSQGQLPLPDRGLGYETLTSSLQNFFAIAANIGLMLGDNDAWTARVGEVRGSVRNAEAKDRSTADFCSLYSGHDSDELLAVLDMLDSAGWEGAKKSLMQGKLSTFLSLGLLSLSAGSVMNCVASILDKEAPSIGITTLLNREMAMQQAEAVAAIRAPATLPSFQFKIVQDLASRLRDVGSEIARITDIKNEVC